MNNHEHGQQRNLEQFGYEHSRQSEFQHHHRSTPSGRSKQPVFQIRAPGFVKKIGFLTSKLGAGARFRPYQDTSDDTKLHAAGDRPSLRKACSMDVLRSKAYVPSPMLTVTSFDSKVLPRKSIDDSHESGSANESDLGEVKSTHSRNISNSNSIAHGLAVAALVADAASIRPMSASSTPPERLGEPRSPNINDVASLGLETEDGPKKSNSNAENNSSGRLESPARRPSEKRPAHPRLTTLPPLTFNLKGVAQDQRPQRFSPSVIVRPPPFPILELPALPTPTAEMYASGSQAQSRPRRMEARLNSLPLLPRDGSNWRENDPDHDRCVLDEDECDDEDNEEDGTTGDADAAGSEGEDETLAAVNGRTSSSSSNATPSPTPSFFPQNQPLPSLLTLPAIHTPSLSTLLGNFSNPDDGSQFQRVDSGSESLSGVLSHVDATSSSVFAESMKQTRDEETTPKAAQANFTWNATSIGSAKAYYSSTSGSLSMESVSDRTEFASESQFVRNHKTIHSSEFPPPLSLSSTVSISSTSAAQTPTVRSQPASQTPMVSVVPPHSPCPRTETVAPFSETQLYKQAGFSIAKGVEGQVPHFTPTGVVDGLPKRPSIYHHASKSMIELFSITSQMKGSADADEDAPKFEIGSDRARKGKGKLLPEVSEPDSPSLDAKDESAEGGSIILLNPGRDRNTKAGQEKALPSTPTALTSGGIAVTSAIRRQRSMPTFGTSGPPPPYPSFLLLGHLQRFAPAPRDDEGTEELPPYSNDIRLTAVMPRKMEFTAPGVPARDRKWRRVHCVLEGTAFRVYDAPPRVTGVSTLGGWWERKMGVGDVSSGHCAGVGATAGPGATTNIVIGRKDSRRRMKWEEELQAEEDARRATEAATEEGSGRPSTSSYTTTVEVSMGVEHDRAQKPKRNLAATLLHPSRSRHSTMQARSPPSASPRSSFQTPRSSVESSNPSSARPSVDLTGIPASSSSTTALPSGTGGSTSASSSSISGLSATSRRSSCGQTRTGHERSDSAQSFLSSSSHSRSNSRARPPHIQEARSQTPLRRHPSRNSYLYHDPSSTDLPEPDETDLLRAYSLQKSESGLASDYMKRKNVVRVRMEGEQFLLQCKDVASVVEWIEGFQAASNIALDLDERQMPKGPIFPRRRRRRRVQRTESATEPPTEATSGPERGAGAGTLSGTVS